MAAHARLKNELTEDEKCHNLMALLNYSLFPLHVSSSTSIYCWRAERPHTTKKVRMLSRAVHHVLSQHNMLLRSGRCTYLDKPLQIKTRCFVCIVGNLTPLLTHSLTHSFIFVKVAQFDWLRVQEIT